MEKTLQAQYNLIQEGKGDKAYFLKSAYRLFPDMVSQINSFSDTVTILKNRGIISENIGGLVTTGKKQDWHAIFNENMDKLKEKKDKEDEDEDEELARRGDEYAQGMEDIHALPNKGKLKEGKKEIISQLMGPDFFLSKKEESTWDDADMDTYNKITKMVSSTGKVPKLNEAKEVKAIEKETTKEITDMATRGYDYKDEKNYDNVFGQEFLQGYYTEMKDPKNEGKNVEELRAIVAKNLAKDINYYVKNGQFGTKGVGYTTEAPGLGEPKEPKGKYKSSGYGDLKESKLTISGTDKAIKSLKSELKNNKVDFETDGNKILVDDSPKTRMAIKMVKERTLGANPLKINEGYGDLKESVLRSQIYLLIKETLDELQKDPKAYADEEEFENKVIAKLKNDLRIKNKQHMTKTGEPDMDLVHQYNDAIKFINKNIQDITSKFFSHDKPEGGIDDAVKYALSNADSNPIHEAKKKPSAGLTKKEKSAISKKAHAGKDIGKKGKGFKKVAKAAEKQYGSEEASKKVAAAAMWKNLAKGGK